MTDFVAQTTFAANAAAGVFTWPGLGRGRVDVPRQDIVLSGNFGGGTATLVASFDGGTTWFNVPADKEGNSVTLVAAGVMTVKARYGLLGLVITGATTPSIVATVI